MKIYGKVLETFPKQRVVKVEGNKRIFYLYMSENFSGLWTIFCK